MCRARVEKHRFGGAMRQAGIVAAAGIYALDHNVERLADDHARARTLADAWAAAGLPVDLELVQSNFVQVNVGSLGIDESEALALIRDRGVLLSPTKPGTLRAVTHLDITDDDVERAVELVPQALEGRVHA
jgi:threonine aldolase